MKSFLSVLQGSFAGVSTRVMLAKRLVTVAWLTVAALLLSSGWAFAAEAAPKIDTGDTAWLIVATALVMIMTPGVALFYGGMVTAKNALSTLMMSFVILCLISLQWVLWGYTLSFGTDINGLIGGLEALGLNGISAPVALAPTIPGYIFVMFQAMFAIITVALITGGFIGRMKFSALIIFALLWATLVYDPLAHWVWGGGFIGAGLGALDFAGGTVVHLSSGAAALAVALAIGARRGYKKEPHEPHNIPLTVLGAALLWFGWFGFNAGSAVAANDIAATAFINTNTATAAAALVWMFLSWRHRKPSVLGIATGAIAGLVAITPAAGFVTPMASIAIGAGAGLLCYYAVLLRSRSRIDDSLDVFGVHGVGGAWGAIATGIFATPTVNELGKGLIAGNPAQVLTQVEAVAITFAFVFSATFVIAKAIDLVMNLRVQAKEELVGLDLSQHGEVAYSRGTVGA